MELIHDLAGYLRARRNYKIIPIVVALVALSIVKRIILLKFI
jgi:hypothetical protein